MSSGRDAVQSGRILQMFQRTSLPMSSVHNTDVSENNAAFIIRSQNRRFRQPRSHCHQFTVLKFLYHQFTVPTFQKSQLSLSSVTTPTYVRILLSFHQCRQIVYRNGLGSELIRNIGTSARLHGVTSH